MFTNRTAVPFCVEAFVPLSQYKCLIIYYIKAYLSPVMCKKIRKIHGREQNE